MPIPEPRVRWPLLPLALSAALAASACRPGIYRPEPKTPPESDLTSKTAAPPADPDAAFAPIPYTVEQLRSASLAGRSMVYVVEWPGKPSVRKRFVFVSVDDERATIATDIINDQGKAVAEPEMETSTWAELRAHGRYPKESTTIVDAVAETPAGTFPCKKYTVIEEEPDGDKRTVACFANDLPGPPVELELEKGGQLVMSMTLVTQTPGTAEPAK